MYIKTPVVIDVLRWHHGENQPTPPSMLDKNGYQCCLGFAASACGVPLGAMRKLETPVTVAANADSLPMEHAVESLLSRLIESRFDDGYTHLPLTRHAMAINDATLEHMAECWSEVRMTGRQAAPAVDDLVTEPNAYSAKLTMARELRERFHPPGPHVITKAQMETVRRDMLVVILGALGFEVAFINIPADERLDG